MLAYCEDILTDEGKSPPDRGAYYRALWRHGASEEQLRGCASKAWGSLTGSSSGANALPLYPEAVLQELDEDWLTELPSSAEAHVYTVNRAYARSLLEQIGDGTGHALEHLAHYLLSCMPGCRTRRRIRTRSTEHDVVCSIEGIEQDFRGELGRYFLCECKDWKDPVDYSALAKFCNTLVTAKCRFGILFARHGITGESRTEDAALEQLNVFRASGLVVVDVNEHDLQAITEGTSLIELLRSKYERIRLDLPR